MSRFLLSLHLDNVIASLNQKAENEFCTLSFLVAQLGKWVFFIRFDFSQAFCCWYVDDGDILSVSEDDMWNEIWFNVLGFRWPGYTNIFPIPK